MEEERIEAVRDWPELQLVRDIQVFLDFANFYRRFIKNFSRIAAALTSRLQTTGNDDLSAQASGHEEDQDAIAGAASAGGGASGGGNIKNLSTAAKSAKSKKPYFAKANFGTDFFTPGAKKAFIQLQKAFIKAPILRHFDQKRHIRIETDALGYVISGVLSQMTSDQLLSNHMTQKT